MSHHVLYSGWRLLPPYLELRAEVSSSRRHQQLLVSPLLSLLAQTLRSTPQEQMTLQTTEAPPPGFGFAPANATAVKRPYTSPGSTLPCPRTPLAVVPGLVGDAGQVEATSSQTGNGVNVHLAVR